jgi:hypothetical protein
MPRLQLKQFLALIVFAALLIGYVVGEIRGKDEPSVESEDVVLDVPTSLSPADTFPTDQQIAHRADGARALELDFLERRKSVEDVRVKEPANTTLYIRNWGCTRAFAYHFPKELHEKYGDVGFKKLECASGTETWTVDL